MISHW